MTVNVTHSKQKSQVVEILDRPLSALFAGVISGFEIAEELRTWNESVMTFSFIGRVGFISIPLAGTMDVRETLVIVDVDLPPVVKMFVGEDKVKAGLEKEILALITRG